MDDYSAQGRPEANMRPSFTGRAHATALLSELNAVDEDIDGSDLEAHLHEKGVGNRLAQTRGKLGENLAVERMPLAAKEPTEATPSTSLAAMEMMVSTTPGARDMPSTFRSLLIIHLPSGFR